VFSGKGWHWIADSLAPKVLVFGCFDLVWLGLVFLHDFGREPAAMPGWQAWQTADAVRTLIRAAPRHSREPSVSGGKKNTTTARILLFGIIAV
jgi:hypothetical protein